MCTTQQLPNDASEVVWHSLPDQFLLKDAQQSALHRPWRNSNTHGPTGCPPLWHANPLICLFPEF
jgi:hypothetical protein